MRLYLSSYQLGDHPELLSAMVGGERNGLVIMNALDGLDEARRQQDTQQQIANLATLGLHATDLDLRTVDPASIADVFGDPDFIWVRGGNIFTLRMAFARSGVDQLITSGLDQDQFAYAGFSAGVCVLAPSLQGLERCDSVPDCIAEYGDVQFDGLGVLDRPIVPHLDSPGHPESEVLGEVAEQYAADGQAYWALRDGQVLVTEGDDLVLH